VPISKKEIRWRWRWPCMMLTEDQYKHYSIGFTKKLTQARPMSSSVHMLLCTSGLCSESLINAMSSFVCFLARTLPGELLCLKSAKQYRHMLLTWHNKFELGFSHHVLGLKFHELHFTETFLFNIWSIIQQSLSSLWPMYCSMGWVLIEMSCFSRQINSGFLTFYAIKH
jgi:hypothetical protein